MKPKIKTEKDLRIFVKKFFKEHLKGLPEDKKFEVKVTSVSPPRVRLHMPFYSEGNLIRANEVDFLTKELLDLGIKVDVFYVDDEVEDNHE